MKYDVFFSYTSAVRSCVEVGNATNPVEADSIADLLAQLVDNLPVIATTEMVGLRILKNTDSETVEIDADASES